MTYLLLNGINTLLVLISVPFKKKPQISKRPSIFKIFVDMAKKFNWLRRQPVEAVSINKISSVNLNVNRWDVTSNNLINCKGNPKNERKN